ncbi:MAG: xylene monooxygenase electron transfer component, partial [Microgenomates group bacterium Gr01-1014_93]
MKLAVYKIKQETRNAFSIYFKKPKNLNYYPAQFLIVKYKGVEREFTVSSSPSEKYLVITPKIGISPLKKFLIKLKPGDGVEIDPPMGTYTLDSKSPAVMIAGGVGITPMRSMIKYALDQKLSIPMTLIYSNSDSDFIFKKELDLWQKTSAGPPAGRTGRRTK